MTHHAAGPLARAEATSYRETSRHADVMRLIAELADCQAAGADQEGVGGGAVGPLGQARREGRVAAGGDQLTAAVGRGAG